MGFVFAVWELIESHFFRDVDYLTLHYLYISRGIVSSFLLAFWAAWYVLRQRRAAEQRLRRSRERYRGLLECSPGAVALYDGKLAVSEWNAAAERLYGFDKDEVLGKQLPTISADEQAAWQSRLARVLAGNPVVDVETRRRTKHGYSIDIQLSVLPFYEDSGQVSFLEVSNDIRERVRLRQMLLQVEKLTAMGQMAAGTAHHLNTPLSSMLLRVQLARKHAARTGLELDLTDLENHIRQCQQFVRRLLDFSRRPQSAKQPESLNSTLEAVITVFTPQLAAKHVHLTANTAALNGCKVLADRNQLEAVFLILLSNALDAVGPHGTVAIQCEHVRADRIVIRDGSAWRPAKRLF